jgi:hypothetical protein
MPPDDAPRIGIQDHRQVDELLAFQQVSAIPPHSAAEAARAKSSRASSSDTDSIAAGEEWLKSIEIALHECSIVVILCSPESIRRPWINFEAGAAWMREIPLIPVCHLGLLPRDLPMPLSLRQGIALSDPDGLRRFYGRVAKILGGDIPSRSFDELAAELTASFSISPTPTSERALERERGIRQRMMEALEDPKWRWRTLGQVAAAAVTSEEYAADLLRADPDVLFGKDDKTGKIIVRLRSHVG